MFGIIQNHAQIIINQDVVKKENVNAELKYLQVENSVNLVY